MSNDKAVITIAVLNYNGRDKLEKTIPSILPQDYEPKEILVLDNGSRDGSVEYLKQFKEIKIIAKETNLGYGAGKNALVKSACGDYILMLDNDMELLGTDFLSNLYEEYKTLTGSAFLSPLRLDADKDYVNSGGLYFNKPNKNIKLKDILNTGVQKVPRYRGGICFFRKEIFEQLGGFDEIYPINIDDYDLSARAYLNGYSNYRTTNLLSTHHGIDIQTNVASLCWKNQYYLSGFSRMIWKNYRLKNALLWWPVSVGWIFYKSLKLSFRYASIRPVCSYFKSFRLFIRDLPDTLNQRRIIQAKRTVKEDIFLKIEPAKPG